MDLELGSLLSWQHTEFQASLGYIARLYQKHRKRELSQKKSQEPQRNCRPESWGRSRQICAGQSWREGCRPCKLQVASSSDFKKMSARHLQNRTQQMKQFPEENFMPLVPLSAL